MKYYPIHKSSLSSGLKYCVIKTVCVSCTMAFCSTKVALKECEEIETKKANFSSAYGGDQISVDHRIAGSVSLSLIIH
jgi:hypothetical protein